MLPPSPARPLEISTAATEQIEPEETVDSVAAYLSSLGNRSRSRNPGTVLLVDHEFPSISRTFVVDKFLHLLVRGWDVHVLSAQADQADWDAYPEIAEQPELAGRVHSTHDFEGLLQRLKPDLVHFEFGVSSLGNLLSCRLQGVRSMVSFRGFDICY